MSLLSIITSGKRSPLRDLYLAYASRKYFQDERFCFLSIHRLPEVIGPLGEDYPMLHLLVLGHNSSNYIMVRFVLYVHMYHVKLTNKPLSVLRFTEHLWRAEPHVLGCLSRCAAGRIGASDASSLDSCTHAPAYTLKYARLLLYYTTPRNLNRIQTMSST